MRTPPRVLASPAAFGGAGASWLAGCPGPRPLTPTAYAADCSDVDCTAPPCAACCTAVSVVLDHQPDLLLLNGPGTCIPIAAAAALLRLAGVCRGRVAYVESIARVYRLSLSGGCVRVRVGVGVG